MPSAKLLLRLALLVLLLGVSIELTTRIEDWVAFRTPLLSPYQSQSELVVRDEDGMHARPNSRFRKWVIDNLGFRGPDASLMKPRGTYRLAAVGASETFGLYESPDQEYPRQLEDSLNAASQWSGRCGTPPRFEVLNAGFPGMSLPTSTQDIRNRLPRFGIDIIVYYPSPTQYLRYEMPVATPPDSSGHPEGPDWTDAFYPRSWKHLKDRLTPKTLERLLRGRTTAARIQSQPPGWRFERIPEDRLAAYDSDLRALIGTIRAIGAMPVLVTHANSLQSGTALYPQRLRHWEEVFTRATGPTILAFDSAGAEVTRTVAADSGVTLVDWRAIVGQATPVGLFGDHVHFTDRGAGMLAGAVGRRLIEVLGQSRNSCPEPPQASALSSSGSR